ETVEADRVQSEKPVLVPVRLERVVAPATADREQISLVSLEEREFRPVSISVVVEKLRQRRVRRPPVPVPRYVGRRGRIVEPDREAGTARIAPLAREIGGGSGKPAAELGSEERPHAVGRGSRTLGYCHPPRLRRERTASCSTATEG